MSLYARDDDASPEVKEQRSLVDMAYESRLDSHTSWREYQTELLKLDKLTGGPG